MNIDQILERKFKLSEFRHGQREIIESVASGNDVMAIMPTGGGKSLCYQLPAFLKPGITLVISPLIALMNDQVRSLRALGLGAGCVHSGLNEAEQQRISSDLKERKKNNSSYILYMSPERVQKKGIAEWLQKQAITLFAIDEAHCVSQWGHDFRKEYSQLATLRKSCPNVPMIALTATATPLVKKDIISHLKLRQADQHVYGFYRPNLFYQVEFCEEKTKDKRNFVLQAVKQTPEGRIIVYCGTRQKTESWAELLEKENEKVGYYHAGLNAADRTEVEKKYARGDIRILAATNAFGMGIDHADVRLVMHTQMPGNIESYYQEIGRAGRDGKDSTCLLLYSKKDKSLHSFFILQSRASSKIKLNRRQALDAMVQYSEGGECRHSDILTYFDDEKRIEKCGHCDSCSPKSDRMVARVEAEKPTSALSKKKQKEAIFSAELPEEAKWRVDVLKEWRKEYAKENDIPAFMVFSDKTLRDLALKAPTNEAELEKVYGMGEKKIEVFGSAVLEKLNP